MSAVQRSIFFSAMERYGSFTIFVVATAILSRLLTPTEFGAYAVANALVVVIGASFQELGGANYLVQKAELSNIGIRTAFTVTFGISILVAVALFASAKLISQFFDQSALSSAIVVSALNFLIVPFSGTVTALFRRKMNFGSLAACNVAATCVGAMTSVTLALLHFSYMAPLWGGVASSATLALMLVIRYRDKSIFRPTLAEYRDVFEFGLYSSGVSIINVFYNLAPQLFLARILDFGAVGLFSRATTLTQAFERLVVQALSPVIMPAIAIQKRSGADLKRIYLEAIELLSAAQWPFLVLVAIMARPLVIVWLGPNWEEIVPLVRLLCVANLALFAACLTYPILVVVGGVRDAMTSSFVSLPPSLLIVLCAAFFGVQAVAAAALVTLPFQTAVAMYFMSRHLAFGPSDIFFALRKSAVVTAVTTPGAACIAVMIESGHLPPLVGLILGSCFALPCWWVGLMVTGHPLSGRLRRAAGDVITIISPQLRAQRS